MMLRQRYKLHRKKLKKSYIILAILLTIIMPKCFSAARYQNLGAASSNTSIAIWSILINGEQVTNNTSSLSRRN